MRWPNALGLAFANQLPLDLCRSGAEPVARVGKRARAMPIGALATRSMSLIGQGYVLTHPAATGDHGPPRLAQQSRRGARRLLRDPLERAVPQAASLDLRPEWLDMIRRVLAQSVNDRRGTAYSSRVVEPTMAMAGKTGTSQVFRITQAERDAGIRRQEDLPWNRRNHALFGQFCTASTKPRAWPWRSSWNMAGGGGGGGGGWVRRVHGGGPHRARHFACGG